MNAPSTEERLEKGKSARRAAPRSRHGAWQRDPGRTDPVALIEEQAADRVPELVPIRHGRMLVSPFTFFRGAALIMASDLADTPTSGLTVQLCGDAHLSNFGLFGSPERQLMFDVNDFDETLAGPWEWDVKRLAASFEVMGRERGFSPDERRSVVLATVGEYRRTMAAGARLGTLDSFYAHFESRRLLNRVRDEARRNRITARELRAVERHVDKALTRDSVRVFSKRATEVEGELRIVADPPLIVPLEDLARPEEWQNADVPIERLLRSYRRTLTHDHHPLEEYRFVHAARKVVGVGSVGTRCYILLMLGRDQRDPLFLQVKEAQPSVLSRYLGTGRFAHQGRRVVVGQRIMQAATDIFLGWQRIKGLDGITRDYYVRQLHDWKGGIDAETLRVPGATLYGRFCGATLARAHMRSGDRIAIASYLGKRDVFDRAVANFSIVYADQNERDYEAFVRAVETGRLEAERGV